MAFHGYPSSEIAEGMADSVGSEDGVGDKDFSRFAANGMSLPCLGSVLLSFILNSHGPWWQKSPGQGVAKKGRSSSGP
jgi:hypothetical protein